MLKPVSTLTRVPDFDGTAAKLTGTFNVPARNVIPAAIASATPAGVMVNEGLRKHGEAEARTGQVDLFGGRRHDRLADRQAVCSVL